MIRKPVVSYTSVGCLQVAWLQQSTGAVLAIGQTVVTRNPRVGVRRPSRTTWVLQFDDVIHRDAGRYMCQISTSPPRKLYGYITVVGKLQQQQSSEQLRYIHLDMEISDEILIIHFTIIIVFKNILLSNIFIVHAD